MLARRPLNPPLSTRFAVRGSQFANYQRPPPDAPTWWWAQQPGDLWPWNRKWCPRLRFMCDVGYFCHWGAPWLVRKPPERVVDLNFGLVFLKIHMVKSYQIYIRVQASLALLSAPRRIAEKKVVRCSRPPSEWFSNRCPVLENGQVESFHRAPVGSHWQAGWVFCLVQFWLGTTQ